MGVDRRGVTAPVIVLGMHRSGTSCLTGSLQQAGLVLGDVHTANPFNKKGNREHPQLMTMHEELLEVNGGSWHSPPDRIEWPPSFLLERDTFCSQFEGVPCWGFKDPRALLAVDGWLARFPDAKLVGTIRHPLAVAQSLYRRDPRLHSLEEYMELWAVYNRQLLEVWGRHRFPVVDFDEPDDVYLASLRRVLQKLGLEEGLVQQIRRQGLLKGVAAVMSGAGVPFFDPALRTHRQQGVDELPAHIAELYLELKKTAVYW